MIWSEIVETKVQKYFKFLIYPPAREASREVANLTEKKSAYLRLCCQRICLHVTNFDHNYFQQSMELKMVILQKII